MQKSEQAFKKHFSAYNWTNGRVIFILSSVRIALILFSIIQDRLLSLKYTDIDFSVFFDARTMILEGSSPYQRTTYRYSPLYAQIFSFFPKSLCKPFLCIVDILTLMLAWKQSNYHDNAAFFICVNLYSAVIASRGNTDCIVALCVIISILLIEKQTYTWSGVFLGIAIHLKLYPVIYVLAYCLNILEIPISFNNITQSAIRISQLSLGIMVGFSFPTVWYFHRYGFEFIEHTYLYHFSRLDARHNLSPYFYLIYLLSGNRCVNVVHRILMALPQILSCASTCIYLRQNLALCMFVETVMFVTFNKVCTCQVEFNFPQLIPRTKYYVWFLYLIPIVIPQLHMKIVKTILLTVFWFAAQEMWMYFGYMIEFKSKPDFIQIWISSLILLSAHTFIICEILKCVKRKAL